MNTYKLNNTMKRVLLKDYKNNEISKKHFSFALINKLCNMYPVSEYIVNHYCCYGEDQCCWIDEESGWLTLGSPIPLSELNRRIYKYLKNFLKTKFTNLNIYSRKMFVAENNDEIVIVIPLRDLIRQDIVIVFDKNENLK